MLVEQLKREAYIAYNHGEKVRIAFMFQVASYWPTIESFYIACVLDENVDVQIFFIDDMSVEKAQVECSEQFLLEHNIPFHIYTENAIREFRPHIALYQPPYDVSYRNPSALSIHLRSMGTRIIYIPYGIEIADTEDARLNHFNTFVVRNAWRIYTFSELMREDYMKYCANRNAVRALGIPKFDAIIKRKEIQLDIIEGAEEKRIILWKMHFPKLIYDGEKRRQVTPYLKEYWKFAEDIEKYEDVFFVVMPHPMFFSQTINSELAEDSRKLLAILAKKKNVKIDVSADYRKALYNAEAIIVDRSAIMVEAGFLDVPVLYMKNADYEEPLTLAIKPLIEAYVQGTEAKDMCSFVEAFRKNELEDARKRMISVREANIPMEVGNCGKRILEDIKDGLKYEQDSKIKLIFFGASFICEHYIKYLDIRNSVDFEIVCLSDNDSKKWGTQKVGYEIIPPDRICEMDYDLIVISSEQYYMPIKKKLVYELYLDEDKIIRLDKFAEQYINGDLESKR